MHTNLLILCWALICSAHALAQGQLSPSPSIALGQPEGIRATDLTKTNFPNLVEGKELNSPQSAVLDKLTGAVYVSDTGNSRVLGWRNYQSLVNGQPADIVIGQKDFYTTFPKGPGSDLTTGFRAPTAVAVDGSGNLYVVDSGNNRILRYPDPFAQPEELKLPNLVIGQPSTISNAPNNGGISARSIRTVDNGNNPFRTGLAFDGDGNLWFTDSGNSRVLRYPAASLGAGASDGPNADRVIGQPDFESAASLALQSNKRLVKTGMRNPSSLALDGAGRLFVADNLNRVLVYDGELFSGQPASRIMGVVVVEQGQTPPLPINERSLGVVSGNNWAPPEGVFTIGNIPFAVDTPANRILRYAPYDEWPAEIPERPSPAAEAVIGQEFLQSDSLNPNRGQAEPSSSSFFNPISGSVGPGNRVIIADSGNNRALIFPDFSHGPVFSTEPPYAAELVLGQPGFENRTVNRIEGREFFFSTPGGTISAADVFIDWNSDPPRMYVADTNNNRVLGFKDARAVRNGTFADIVIGQPGMFRSVINYPSNDVLKPTATGLFFPTGVAVDSNGDLFVADWGNGRVLRFPKPFDQPQGQLHEANLVIGQLDFTSRQTDATSRTMNAPWGLNFTLEGALLVSDSSHNRVLEFRTPFENGMAAVKVFGQPDFLSTNTGNSLNRMRTPRGISTDTSARLYVVDFGNDRVLVWGDIRQAPSADSQAAIPITGLRDPQDVYVSPETGKAWVAETGASRALRFPEFTTMQIEGVAFELAVSAPAPLAVAQDPFGNLFVADAFNRIAAYFQGLAFTNAANFLSRAAPGMITSLWFPENSSIQFTAAGIVPLPTELSDVSVSVDGKLAPLYFVSPGQVNFLMPNDAPASGTVTVTIFRPSTQQIIASSPVQMDVASPGLFTRPPTGTGQVAALNQDNSINSDTNPARIREVIQIFATGAGFIPGAPPDGHVATGLIRTPETPQVFIGARQAEVQFSGLAPSLVGVWQINAFIPEQTAAGNAFVVVIMNSRPSGDPNNPGSIVTTIAVRR